MKAHKIQTLYSYSGIALTVNESELLDTNDLTGKIFGRNQAKCEMINGRFELEFKTAPIMQLSGYFILCFAFIENEIEF